MSRPVTRLVLGTLVVAWIATLGDFIWYEGGVTHRMVIGIVHGAVLLTAVGGVLGWTAGRTPMGLPLGTVAGLAGALTYYALQPIVGQTAMLVAWASLWIALAMLDARWLCRTRAPGQAVLRGTAAAMLSGLTFWLVVDQLWGREPAGGRDYLWQFFAWAAAWAPGILVIGWPAAPTTVRS